MKCVNCGASYPDLKEQCPYCGSENTKRAEEEHKNKLEWYAIKSAFLRELPRILGRVAGKFVVKLLIVLIVGGIVIALVSGGIARIKSDVAYENKASVMDKLETMYQEEDYESMMELLKLQEHYLSATYGRYYRVGELNEIYQSVAGDMDERIASTLKYGEPQDLQYPIRQLFKILSYCKEYEEAGYVYDEGEEVEDFRQKTQDLLKVQCFLNEREIEQGLLLYENEEDMTEICQFILERYQEAHTEE